MIIRRAEGLAAGAHYIEAQAIVPAGLAWGENPQQFRGIEPVTAYDAAIQQQHRDVQTVAALQIRVGIHVHHVDGRQDGPPSQGREFSHHLLAQFTVLAMHYCEAHRIALLQRRQRQHLTR